MRIQYRDQEDFERIAAKFGIFEEWKVLYTSLDFNSTSLVHEQFDTKFSYMIGTKTVYFLRICVPIFLLYS